VDDIIRQRDVDLVRRRHPGEAVRCAEIRAQLEVHFCLIRTDLKVVRLPSRICRLSVAAMDALLALVRDRPAAFTTQPISREFD
jgi:hypothetical protein